MTEPATYPTADGDVARSRAGQLAADAMLWAARGFPDPPTGSVAELSEQDRAIVARVAGELDAEIRATARRACGDAS